jgi:hypothetical protein
MLELMTIKAEKEKPIWARDALYRRHNRLSSQNNICLALLLFHNSSDKIGVIYIGLVILGASGLNI